MSHDLPDDQFVVLATALAVRMDRPGEFRFSEEPVRRPDAGEVLIQVIAAGIGTDDLKLLDGVQPGDVTHYPVIPGHEWPGRVVALGGGSSARAWGSPSRAPSASTSPCLPPGSPPARCSSFR